MQSAAPGTAFADGVHHLGRPQQGHSVVKELLRAPQVRSSWGNEASVDHPGTYLYRFDGTHIKSLDIRRAIENVSVKKSKRRRLRRKEFRNDSIHSVNRHVMSSLRAEE